MLRNALALNLIHCIYAHHNTYVYVMWRRIHLIKIFHDLIYVHYGMIYAPAYLCTATHIMGFHFI